MIKLDYTFIKKWMYNDIIKYKLIYYNSIDNIYLYIYNKNNNKNKELIDKIIELIIFFKNNFEVKNNIYINIYLTNYKKYYPNPNNNIDIDNVNSGVCYLTNNYSFIYIWRKEELLKVLIHELLHSIKIDNNMDKIDNMINKRYNIEDNINSNEIYVETIAELIYIKKYKKNFKKNLKYMKMQCNRLIKHNNFNNINELLRINSKKIFNQKTSIFSYYIMKTALLNNIQEFINFIETNGIYFHKKNSNKFFILLNESFDKLCLEISDNYYKGNSLRMTI